MENRKVWIIISVMFIVFLIGLTGFYIIKPVNLSVTNREVKLTVIATADLHGGIPTKLAEYIQREKRH